MSATLHGQRLLVVGASAGIGRATAIHAARLGAAVAFCGRRRGALEGAVHEAGSGEIVVADVTDPVQCESLVADTVKALGGIDVLLFAAGASRLGLLRTTTADDWQLVLRTNVIGPALVTRAALPHLSERAFLAFVSSESVGSPYPGLVPYTSSKAALEELIRGWRSEHPELRWACITVGPTEDTEFARDFDAGVAAELFPRWIAMGRIPGKMMLADELGAVIAQSLAVAMASPGVDVHHLVFRPPGGTHTGSADFLLDVVEGSTRP